MLKISITTPEKVILETEIKQVALPTTEGEITVLENHVPLMVALAAGDIVVWNKAGDIIPMAVVGGFARVHQHVITILADFAEEVAFLSDQEIKEAKERALAIMAKGESLSDDEFELQAKQLEYALTRERIAGKWKNKKYKNVNVKT